MNILIVKTSALGDIIHVYPVLEYLKMIHPNCQIDWVVEKTGEALVRSNPYVRQAIVCNTKDWRKGKNWKEIRVFIKRLRHKHYDVVFDLQGNTKSGMMTAFAKATAKVGFGWRTAPEKPNLLFTQYRYNPLPGKNIREDYLYLVQSYFNDFRLPDRHIKAKTADLNVMICPGSNWANKQISHETLLGFLEQLTETVQTKIYLVWGTQAEKDFVQKIHLQYPESCIVDKMPLPELQKLMQGMKVVIAMDSLPLHLAGTTSALTYSIFGASSAHKYNPLGEKHLAFQGQCPYGRTFEKRCSILRTCPTGACIKEITSEQMWNHFWPWFQKHL